MSVTWVIYAVWIVTDDFYDDGHYSSFHVTKAGAETEAARILGTDVDGVGTVMSAETEEIRLKD